MHVGNRPAYDAIHLRFLISGGRHVRRCNEMGGTPGKILPSKAAGFFARIGHMQICAKLCKIAQTLQNQLLL